MRLNGRNGHAGHGANGTGAKGTNGAAEPESPRAPRATQARKNNRGRKGLEQAATPKRKVFKVSLDEETAMSLHVHAIKAGKSVPDFLRSLIDRECNQFTITRKPGPKPTAEGEASAKEEPAEGEVSAEEEPAEEEPAEEEPAEGKASDGWKAPQL